MSSLSCARRAAVPTRGRPAPAHPSGSTNGRSFQPIPASHFAILGILPRLQRVSSASMSRMASRTAQGSGSARRSQSRSHSRHASSRPCCTGYADQQDRNPSRCGCPSRRGPPGKEPDEGKGRSARWGAGLINGMKTSGKKRDNLGSIGKDFRRECNSIAESATKKEGNQPSFFVVYRGSISNCSAHP